MTARGVRWVIAIALLAGVAGAAPNAALAKGRFHIVESGETLWVIARRYGCEVAKLSELNRLDGTLIQPGQKLALPVCDGRAIAPAARVAAAATDRPAATTATASAGRIEHLVVAGETLGKLAGRYGVKIDDLRERNGLDGDRIYAGQKLIVSGGRRAAEGPPSLIGQSIGRPAGGNLVQPTRLPDDGAYHVRRPERRYGTGQAVYHIRRAARSVRSRYPKLHKLAVGDLSVKSGGKITLHNSHQSGRDVDLGFYFKTRPSAYPESFVKVTKKNLHFDATWLLIETLARTSTAPNGVERMFLTYDIQELLYERARERGVPLETLDWLFQYPHGEYASTGLIRHWPNHEDHIHVRFQCPVDDSGCE